MRRDIDALAHRRFDVAIVGGGVHGAWIALRAARSGLAVALLERDDFAAGTSANSLKILHGGLRYLQRLDLPRMRRSLRARREHARWFPHLFEPLPCVMPLLAAGLRSPWIIGPALLANELVSARRNEGVGAACRLPAGRLLSAQQCEHELASLVERRPFAGALWWDGVARDAERLTLEAVIAAAEAGAQVANHAEVEAILHADGRVHGVGFVDRLTGRAHELRAQTIVNAAGPWAAALLRRSGLPDRALPAAWTGAMNLLLGRPLGNRVAIALTTSRASFPTSEDGVATAARRRRGARELFFVPWRGRTMIGTGYCAVGSVEEGMQGPPPGSISRFMGMAATLAPAARIEPEDLALVHWGLMPLAHADDMLPRRSPLLLSDAATTGAEGLVTVIGEKLTSAPEVALRVLPRLLPAGRKVTRAAVLRPRRPSSADAAPGIADAARLRLQSRYGARWPDVVRDAQDDPRALKPLLPGSPVLCAELRHALETEMACNLADLLRRVGAGQSGHPGLPFIEACAAWAASHAQWDKDRLRAQVRAVDAWFLARSRGAGTRIDDAARTPPGPAG